MREIKFRSWDKRFKIMGYGEGDLLLRINDKDFSEPMQFTGLKDKNGKEIYEGDIFKCRHSEDDSDFICFYGYSDRVFKVKFEKGMFIPFNTFGGDAGKVIGNVWENPELIN